MGFGGVLRLPPKEPSPDVLGYLDDLSPKLRHVRPLF